MKRFSRFSLITVLCSLTSLSALAADITITAASVLPSTSSLAKFGQCTAGVTIAAGQVLYQDSATNTCKLADADASATTAKVIGIALQNVGSGQRVRYCSYDPSFTIGATVVIGDNFWLSTTAGGITKTASEGVATASYVCNLGVAISTTKIFLNITKAGAVRP